VGLYASGTNYGTAVGGGANGDNSGVAIGFGANGAYHGIALGPYSWGTNFGLGMGYYANGANSGVALGPFTIATNGGMAMGLWASGPNSGVAIGMRASAPGSGNVAIGGADWGWDSAAVPSNWNDTVEIGRGTATLQGGLNFRGYGIVNSSGVIVAPISASNLVVNGGVTMTNGSLDVSGTTISGLSASQISVGRLTVDRMPTNGVWNANGMTASNLTIVGYSPGTNCLSNTEGVFSNLTVSGSASISNLTVNSNALVANLTVSNLTVTSIAWIPAQGDFAMGSFTNQP